MKKDRCNCREYCRFTQYCYKPGEPGLDPDDCPTAWRIEDCAWDAECAKMDELKYEKDDQDETDEFDDWEE